MGENKNEQYTFGPEEKEIIQKMSIVEASVARNNERKNQRELIATKYYSEFIINTKKGPVTLNNVFITAERNKEGEMSYHFRWIMKKENGEQTIEENLVIDENGNIYVSDGFKDFLGDAEKVDIEALMAENDSEKGRLKGKSEKVESKKIEQEEERGNEQDDETQEVEEDLQEQGEDFKISKYRKIKDTHVAERMPEVFGDGTENGIAFSNKLNRYVIISKVDGHYQINENVEPAKMTWKTIISIDADGKKVEREVPHALMQVPNNDKKEIAVTLDNYGDTSIQTVDVLPCQERVARSVQMENVDYTNPEKGAERKDVRDTFNQEGGVLLSHDIAHKQEILEREYQVTETDIEELKDLDIEAVMEREARKAKISKEGFKEYVKKADGKTLQDKIINAHEQIEQEYKGGQRPR